MRELFYYLTNDRRLQLATNLVLPHTKGRCPWIVLLHGFTESRNDKDLVSFAHAFAKAGIATVRFDASGSGGSEGSSHTDFRVSHFYRDLECIVKLFATHQLLDKERVGALGHSLGGMLALIFAAQTSRLKVVGSLSPTSSILEATPLKEALSEWQTTDQFSYTRPDGVRDSIGYGFVEDAQAWKALDHVEQLQTPVLMTIGQKDTIVLPEDSRSIHTHITTRKVLITVSEMGHYDQYHFLAPYIVPFFERALKR